MRERLRRLLRLRVAEEHAEAVLVFRARRVADLLDGLQEPLAREERRVELGDRRQQRAAPRVAKMHCGLDVS